MPNFLYFALSLLMFIGRPSLAATPAALTLRNGDRSTTLNLKDLLKQTQVKELQIPLLNYPDRALKVKAIPAKFLLESLGIQKGQILQYECLDGYAGLIDASLLLTENPSSAVAFIAIEDPAQPWPALPKASNTTAASAGPFYLVWQNPDKSAIPAEFWPYQLKELRTVSSIEKTYPALVPKSDASKDVKAGFSVFQTRCLSCHQLNKAGPAQVGPDLNLPMNPTEYFQSAALKKYIQDPSSVRAWSGMRMRWVQKPAFTEEEVDVVIHYLSYMAQHKTP